MDERTQEPILGNEEPEKSSIGEEEQEILGSQKIPETVIDLETSEIQRSMLPPGRVKRIMKLDREINKVNSEALFLISLSTDLFLQFLTEKSVQITVEKRRKTLTLEHLRSAVSKHSITRQFLLECLPVPFKSTLHTTTKSRSDHGNEKPLPSCARRIDDFFKKNKDVNAE